MCLHGSGTEFKSGPAVNLLVEKSVRWFDKGNSGRKSIQVFRSYVNSMSCPGAPIKSVKRRTIDLTNGSDDESVMDSPMTRHLKRRRLSMPLRSDLVTISSDEESEESKEEECEEESSDLDETQSNLSSDSEEEEVDEVTDWWSKPVILDVVPPLVIPVPVELHVPEVPAVADDGRGFNRWVFTVNNWTEAELSALVEGLPTQCEWAVVAREVGGDNAVPHLQGIPVFQLSGSMDCYCGHCHCLL